MRDDELDFTVARLGECRVQSPMTGVRFTRDEERVLYHATLERLNACLGAGAPPPAMECAGPRQMLFFDPAALKCGIVTCGGLCPGLNDVIRAVVLSLHQYGVMKVYGFRYGYEAANKFQDQNWDDVEPDLTMGWDEYEHRGNSTWENVKDAVRDAWDRVTGKRHVGAR